MRSPNLVVGFCVLLASAGFAAGQAATAPATAPSTQPSAAVLKAVDALIVQLGDDTWQTRQQAQDKLVECGEDAYGRLVEAAKIAQDEELRNGLRMAIARIEENRTSGPSLITLHFKDAHPKDVFEAVARQARTEFRVYPPKLWEQQDWPKVTIDADRASFWTVLKELSEKTGVSPQNGYGGNDRRLALVQGGGMSFLAAPSVVAGPFLVTAQNIYRSNTINLLQPQAVQHQFSIQFIAYSEPKLRILQYSPYVRLEAVTDDKGNSLMLPGIAYEGLSSSGGWTWNLSAQLRYPDNAGTRIAKLKGSARFVIQSRAETFEIPDIMAAANVTKTVGARRYTLKQVRKQNDQVYGATVVMHRDGRTPQEWGNLQNTFSQGVGVQVMDAKGRTYAFGGTSNINSTGEAMEVTYLFNRADGGGDEGQPGEPVKLVWEVTVETKQISVPFEISDLPVP